MTYINDIMYFIQYLVILIYYGLKVRMRSITRIICAILLYSMKAAWQMDF